MSIQAIAWAFNEAPVKDPATLLVLMALANEADKYGRNAFPSRETIAGVARLSVRSVSTKLAALEEAGVIMLGDQQKVAHIPVNRRPKVYDINFGVQLSHPIGSGYHDRPIKDRLAVLTASPQGVQDASPQESDDDGSGVKDAAFRGEAQSYSGVKPDAHNPTTNPKDNPIGVSEVPQQEPLDLSRQDTHWRPSPAALAQAKQGVRLADINLSITTYEVWCKRKGRTPNNGDWLSWVLRDEKDAREAERERARVSRKYQGWAHVEE